VNCKKEGKHQAATVDPILFIGTQQSNSCKEQLPQQDGLLSAA